ncbi:MAG TPA: hypothetical protein VFT17_12055, partial [Propionibacteriaceae bacterium]|nr:hypothetical protein [Propionibacteriaceae bacterium]
TCGLAAAMFSTLAAITGWLLTLPPVSGSVDLARGVGVPVGEGVGVGDDELGEVELLPSGTESGRLSAAATPMPPATTTAAAAMATVRARLMNRSA